MKLLRWPESLSRDPCRKTRVLPLRLSRERDLLPPVCAKSRADGPDYRPSDAHLRRREKYAAAVALAAAISAVLAETAWAGGLTGDAARGETLYEACQDCHSLDKNDVGPFLEFVAFADPNAEPTDFCGWWTADMNQDAALTMDDLVILYDVLGLSCGDLDTDGDVD